ncbi:MAG: hypothetical protein ACK4MX_01105 [Thermaurantiacus sp.]
MMRDDPVALAGLLVRRLTHDLAGPVTAMATLAALREADALEEAALAELRDRLALFRAIFAGAPDGPVELAETGALFARQAEGLTVELALDPAAAPARLRAGLALGLEARALVAAGGRIVMTVAGSGAIRVDAAPLARELPAMLADACAGGAAGLSPHHAPAAFAAALAGPVRLDAQDRRLVLIVDPV